MNNWCICWFFTHIWRYLLSAGHRAKQRGYVSYFCHLEGSSNGYCVERLTVLLCRLRIVTDTGNLTLNTHAEIIFNIDKTDHE
jgi:hypothetical protein